jgi:hypothetical protein
MRNAFFAALWACAILCGIQGFGAVPRFEKVSEHCYYLQLKDKGENVAAVVTDEGVLLIDPPQEPGLSITMEALGRLTPKPVRWLTFTEPRYVNSSGTRYFSEKGAFLLAGGQLRSLVRENTPKDTEQFRWFIFSRQMFLFPAGVEIRILALQHKSRTGGDAIVFVPDEKVLFVGNLFEAARYPEIDSDAGGSPAGWFDGMKQVVDYVPVLKAAIPPKSAKAKPVPLPKPAIPPAKPEEKPEPEITLEEGFAVVSATGEVSNFQNAKDLLEGSLKLRNELSRIVKAGRPCESFLISSISNPYRSYGNLEPFADRLCEALSVEPEPPK